MGNVVTTLVKKYREGSINRRIFLKKLTIFTGAAALARSIFALPGSGKAQSSVLQTADNDLITEFIKYPVENGEMRAFMACPKKGNKFPAVIVIHENRGLVPHIQDVTRRMAREGFLSVAPDALSPLGGTPEDTSNVGEMFKKLDDNETTRNFVAAVKYLKTHPKSTGKVGCTGFCWGGARTNQVAVNAPDLNAAVPYYGRQPAESDVAKINAPVMAHYAGNDPGVNAGIPAFEEALKKYKKEYQIFMYEGASHAFNNDSNPERYNEKAARLAWERTIAFFREKLK